MTNDRMTRYKATKLVGGFCKGTCKNLTERLDVNGEFRVCSEKRSCPFLMGGCSLCGDYTDFNSLVVHHKNFDGDRLEGKSRSGFHERIINGRRKIDDLTVLCQKCHNDPFVLRWINECYNCNNDTVDPFSINYHNPTIRKLGLETASFLIFDQRWQGTTLWLLRNKPVKATFTNGYLKCESGEEIFIFKLINGKAKFCLP